MKLHQRAEGLRFLLLQAAAIGLLAVPSLQLHAATYTWDGGGADANWGTAANWDATPTFNNQADIIFNASAAANLSNFLGAARTIRSLTFNADSDSAVSIRTTTTASGNTAANLTFDTDTVGGDATITVDAGSAGNHTIGAGAGSIVLADNLVIDHNGSGILTLGRPVTGAFNLTKTGTGRLSISGANTYSGATTVSEGRLLLASAGALSPNTAVTVSDSAQLFFQSGAANQTYTNAMTISGLGHVESEGTQFGAIRLGNGVNLGGTLTLPADARVGINNTANVTLSGQVTGSGGLEFYGVNGTNNVAITFNLSNTGNDYAGTTTISSKDLSDTRTGASATLKLGASGVIPDGVGKGIVSFTGADANHLTILDLNGFNETVNGLSNTAAAGARITTTAAGTAVLTVGAANTNSSFSGVITEAGSGAILALSKTGTGTLTLSGSNTYTGATTISAGTLKLDVAGAVGSSSGLSIASGASLDLSEIAGGLTLGSGQSLGGAGSILGDLVFGDGSKLVFSTTDTLAMSGGTASFFAGTPGSRFGIDDLLGISSSTPLGTYPLISGTVNTTNLDNLGSANAFDLGSGVSAYFQQGSLQVVVVPEPGTLALAAAGHAGVAWAVTRRRRPAP
jgi:autotransporter-associated beta strand protein